MFKTRKKVKESSNFIAAYKCKIWFRTPKKATTQTSRKCLRLKYSVEYLDLSDREGGGGEEKTTRSFEFCTLHIVIGILHKMGETNGHGSTVIE